MSLIVYNNLWCTTIKLPMNYNTPPHSLHLAGIQAPTLRDLTDHVRTTEWIHLGRKLGIEEDTLAVIKSNRRLDATGALMDVLTKWWRACEDPTWVAMVAALREIGEGNLARRLEDKFC